MEEYLLVIDLGKPQPVNVEPGHRTHEQEREKEGDQNGAKELLEIHRYGVLTERQNAEVVSARVLAQGAGNGVGWSSGVDITINGTGTRHPSALRLLK